MGICTKVNNLFWMSLFLGLHLGLSMEMKTQTESLGEALVLEWPPRLHELVWLLVQ